MRLAYTALLFAALGAIFAIGGGKTGSAQLLPRTPNDLSSPQRHTAAVLLPRLAARLAQRQRLTIIAFGSSSTEGIGASTPLHAYPALLQDDLRQILGPNITVSVRNRGIGGQDADDMLARLAVDVLRDQPDLVIWQTGTNDPLRNVPLERFIAETKEGIRQMRAAGIEVMLMEPQDCKLMRATPGSGAYRNAVREIGKELAVPVIRRYDLIKAWLAGGKITEAELMAPDGLHMADAGYARLAAEVARELIADAGIEPRPATMVATY